MARTVITLTDSWQELATVACILRVKSVPDGSRRLSLNQSASDTAALEDHAVPGEQYAQNEDKSTFAKGDGVVITIDTAG